MHPHAVAVFLLHPHIRSPAQGRAQPVEHGHVGGAHQLLDMAPGVVEDDRAILGDAAGQIQGGAPVAHLAEAATGHRHRPEPVVGQRTYRQQRGRRDHREPVREGLQDAVDVQRAQWPGGRRPGGGQHTGKVALHRPRRRPPIQRPAAEDVAKVHQLISRKRSAAAGWAARSAATNSPSAEPGSTPARS